LIEVIDEFIHKHIPNLDRAAYKLALGKYTADKPPFSEQALQTLRDSWFKLLPNQEAARIKTEFQPFWCSAVPQTLRCLGDPDWKIWDDPEGGDSFAKGVPIGIESTLARTPTVFPKKTKWRKYDDSNRELFMENYRSAVGAGEALRKQFLEEEKEGLMFRMKLSEAKERFPNLRVAAQGAI
jgi:hypothetical protein